MAPVPSQKAPVSTISSRSGSPEGPADPTPAAFRCQGASHIPSQHLAKSSPCSTSNTPCLRWKPLPSDIPVLVSSRAQARSSPPPSISPLSSLPPVLTPRSVEGPCQEVLDKRVPDENIAVFSLRGESDQDQLEMRLLLGARY